MDALKHYLNKADRSVELCLEVLAMLLLEVTLQVSPSS